MSASTSCHPAPRGVATAAVLQSLEQRTLLSVPFAARINFQPASVDTYDNYVVDGGLSYGPRANGYTYGWNTDNTAQMRDRNSAISPDQRYDTFAIMQKSGSSYTWELAVPNGQYFVDLIGGDPTSYGAMNVGVEGTSVLNGTTSSSKPFLEASAFVTVSDGKLSLQNLSSTTIDKINSIRVAAVPSNLGSRYAEVQQSVDDVDAGLARGDDLEVRALTRAAYAALAINYPTPDVAVSRAVTYLNAAFATQRLTDGNFPWTQQDNDFTDTNAVQFVMSYVSLIWKQYGARLGSAFWTGKQEKIAKALDALTHQDIDSTIYPDPRAYTNIFTMKFTNEILLGEMLNDSGAQDTGKTDLNDWITYIKGNGQFTEFDSPTYSTVTLNNLDALYNNTSTTSVKNSAKGMLDVLSYDLSANFFSSDGITGALSGPHARDYEFTRSRGSIGQFYEIEGLQTPPSTPGDPSPDGIGTYLNLLEGGYHPDSTITNVARQPVRVVQTTYGSPSAGQDRYNYITPGFALGSTSAYYGPQDKQIVGSFASTRAVSDVTVIYDGSDDDQPYGENTVGGLHPKPVHLKNASATVQEKGALVSLSDLRPQFASDPNKKYKTVSSNVIFPGTADRIYRIAAGGQVTDLNANGWSTSYSEQWAFGDVLGVRQGDTVFAIRPQYAEGLSTFAPELWVKFDGDAFGTDKLHDARIVAYHYKRSTAQAFSGSTNCRFAVAIAATTVTGVDSAAKTAAAVAFLQNVHNTTFTLNDVLDGNGKIVRWKSDFGLNGVDLKTSQYLADDAIDYRHIKISNTESPYVAARFSIFDMAGNEQSIASLVLDYVPLA